VFQFPTVPASDLPRLYRTAADIIETRGWTSGRSVGPNNERCAGAAINEAAGRHLRDVSPDIMGPFALWLVTHRREQVLVAFEHQGFTFPPEVGGRLERLVSGNFAGEDMAAMTVIQRWNDDDGTRVGASFSLSVSVGSPLRSKDEVVAALRECAASLDGSVT
jgi:hypothetical protein